MIITSIRSFALVSFALCAAACEFPTVCPDGMAANPETDVCEPYMSPYPTPQGSGNARHIRQETPVWCWAATIAMASDAAGVDPPRQCELASVRISRPLDYCCPEGAGIQGYGCNSTAQVYEMVGVMEAIGLQGTMLSGPAPAEALAYDIDQGLAAIIGFSGLQGGHVMIVDDYVYGPAGVAFRVFDPYTGSYDTVPYQNMGSYGPAYWSVTFLGIERSSYLSEF